jgi:CTP:molybdopterin cytidylyltransferase MocA
VLAAGGGTRFAGEDHKLLAPWRGRPLVWWAIDAAAEAGLARTWVVTGAVDLELAGVVPRGVEVLRNRRWMEGQATSLALAVSTAKASGIEAIVVGLGDQPLVVASSWTRLATTTSHPIAVAVYGGRRGNPVRLASEVWPLLPASGDEGARTLIFERPDLVAEVACEGDPTDIDTAEDLARWS